MGPRAQVLALALPLTQVTWTIPRPSLSLKLHLKNERWKDVQEPSHTSLVAIP